MMLRKGIFWIVPLVSFLHLAGCSEVAAPVEPPPEEASATAEPASEAARSEDQILIERTPVPTATPDRISLALTQLAESAGWTDEVILGLTLDDWIDIGVSILIVGVGYALGSLLIRVLLSRISRRIPPPHDAQVKDYFGSKLRQLALVYLLRTATLRLSLVSAGLKNTLSDLYFVVGLVIVTQIGLKIIDLAAAYYTERLEPPDRRAQLTPITILITRLAYAALIIFSLSAGLARFGINITALAAALGIAGLGFALAAQDTIADAIAGILILADRPFRVGDRIEIEAAKTWGDVMDIGLRSTRIRTRDNRVVIIPNSTIGKNEVINYSYPDPTYRIETHVGIGYGTDIEHARRIMIDAVRGVEGVLLDKPIDALYIEMGDSDMKFRVRWWIDSYVDTRRMFDKVHTALQNALDGAGIETPFPIQELHHRLTSDQVDQLPETLRIRETRRKPQVSKFAPEDSGSDESEKGDEAK